MSSIHQLVESFCTRLYGDYNIDEVTSNVTIRSTNTMLVAFMDHNGERKHIYLDSEDTLRTDLESKISEVNNELGFSEDSIRSVTLTPTDTTFSGVDITFKYSEQLNQPSVSKYIESLVRDIISVSLTEDDAVEYIQLSNDDTRSSEKLNVALSSIDLNASPKYAQDLVLESETLNSVIQVYLSHAVNSKLPDPYSSSSVLWSDFSVYFSDEFIIRNSYYVTVSICETNKPK